MYTGQNVSCCIIIKHFIIQLMHNIYVDTIKIIKAP